MFLRSRVRLSPEAVRNLCPVRAPHAEWTQDGDDLRVTIRRSPGRLARMASWVFTVPERRSFVLDRPGASVWQKCDGRTRVRAMAASMAQEFGWPADRAEHAVLAYLGLLSERRLVGFPPVPPEWSA